MYAASIHGIVQTLLPRTAGFHTGIEVKSRNENRRKNEGIGAGIFLSTKNSFLFPTSSLTLWWSHTHTPNRRTWHPTNVALSR